jgi:ankyrin repeat protein
MAKKYFAMSREMEKIVASLSSQLAPQFLELLERGEKIDARQRSNGATLLMVVIRARIPHLIELLIEKGADIDAKDMEGVTPLMEAVIACDVETVQLLLRKGANPNKKTRSGFTAITWTIALMNNNNDDNNPFITNNHNKYEEIAELIRQSGGE